MSGHTWRELERADMDTAAAHRFDGERRAAMSELLPCPFCGEQAEILTAESMYGGNLYGVMCDCCAGRADVYDTEAEAITAWNTRAERTCECVAEYAKSPIDGKTIVLHRCSACRELMRPHMHYCPNCGARVVE